MDFQFVFTLVALLAKSSSVYQDVDYISHEHLSLVLQGS